MCPRLTGCVHVSSAYEAAAELLAAPTAAMVVDLQMLSLRHLRLLKIAREMDVEVLAVGSLPAGLTAEQLSGVRLVSIDDLPNVLTRLARTPDARPEAAVEAPAQKAEKTTPEPAQPPRVVLTPAKKPTADKPKRPPRKPQALTGDGPKKQAEPPTLSTEDVLTPEELAALLEDES
ncbi:MAG: hypothetical protein SVT52_03415 [Planctomycetota bacterium]|nr:hypothetical protein [Planctomycetota bacterium]